MEQTCFVTGERRGRREPDPARHRRRRVRRDALPQEHPIGQHACVEEHRRDFSVRFASDAFEIDAGEQPRVTVVLTNCSNELERAPFVFGFLRNVGSTDWDGAWFGFAPLPGREILPGETIQMPVYFGDRQHLEVGEYEIRVAIGERHAVSPGLMVEGARLRVRRAVPRVDGS